MDIKPAKKRKLKPINNVGASQDISRIHGKKLKIIPRSKNEISLKEKDLNSHTKLVRKKNKKTKLFCVFNKYKYWLLALILLSLVYLPASQLINTEAQYSDLIAESTPFSLVQNNISFAPQKLLIAATDNSFITGSTLVKAISFIFSLGVVLLFYLVVNRWLGKTVSILATSMFATTTWLILQTQSINFYGIYLIFIPAVLYLYYLYSEKSSYIYLLIVSAVLSIALYSPGMLWLVISIVVLGLIFMKDIIIKMNPQYLIVSIITSALLLVPLIVGLVKYVDNFSIILTGKNDFALNSLTENLQNNLSPIFYNGLNDNNIWLSGTPIIDIIAAILFFFGIIYLLTKRGFKNHSILLGTLLIFSMVVIAFVGQNAMSLIIPAIFFIIAFGIKLLLDSWFSIFPNNPFARNLGLALVIFIVLLSVGYNIARYHIAWPESQGIVRNVEN